MILRTVSLFCGCGGADLGVLGGFTFLGHNYPLNPVSIVHASDIDAKAIASYNSNFSQSASATDVHDVTFTQDAADLVIGGFPCQSFSTVNPNKDPNDHRAQLYWQLARVIDEIQPKAFIAENVKGFFTLGKGVYFRTALAEFERLGYRVSYKLINSADYGVPQLRQRLFMVGVRDDLDVDYSFPEPTHGPDSSCDIGYVPLGSVIDSLIPDDPKYYFSQRAVEGVKRAKPNMKRALAQNMDSPCLTITSHLAKVSLNSRDPVLLVSPEKELYRRFTPREAARIQSFPDTFQFAGSEADAYRQIGNAIPPVVMWHLVNALVDQLPTSGEMSPRG